MRTWLRAPGYRDGFGAALGTVGGNLTIRHEFSFRSADAAHIKGAGDE